MIIPKVSLVDFRNSFVRMKSSDNKEHESAVHKDSVRSYKSVSGAKALAQMPNVHFLSKHYNYGRDDFSAYDNYEGPQPPQIEIEKYSISRHVDQCIANENYLSAIDGKIKIARICRSQGKEHDAFMLENSIRRLYKDLPLYQREEAKSIISDYNHDMAKYIDQDIARM